MQRLKANRRNFPLRNTLRLLSKFTKKYCLHVGCVLVVLFFLFGLAFEHGYPEFSPTLVNQQVTRLFRFNQNHVGRAQDALPATKRLNYFSQPLVDIVLFNDELPMLDYRLRLHSPIVSKFVIVESNITFKGRPKPLYAQRYLESGGFEKYDVLVLQVPFSRRDLESNDTWVRERATRRFLTDWIWKNLKNSTVVVSDVDELIDTEALMKIFLTPELDGLQCLLIHMRFLYYGEACPMKSERWNFAVLFYTGGSWFQEVAERREGIRPSPHPDEPFVGGTCTNLNSSAPLLGWHMSYAMGTSAIINKLQSFSESGAFVHRLLDAANTSSIIEDRIRRCADIYGRDDYPILGCRDVDTSMFDFKSLPLAGAPQHPLAPRMEAWAACAKEKYRTNSH